MSATRKYTVTAGRVVVLPKSTQAGPGGTNARYAAGEVLEVVPDRFIRRRVAVGDLVEGEVAVPPPEAAAPRPATKGPALDLAGAATGKKG
jgi:hypothetical protein